MHTSNLVPLEEADTTKTNPVLKKKKNYTKLTTQGYIVNKAHDLDRTRRLYKDLTVQPLTHSDFGQTESFPIFIENDKYMLIPKYYGLEKLGKPDKNRESIGEEINVTFTGKLKPLQQTIADKVLEKIDSSPYIDGGILSLPCGYGKTVLSLYLACCIKKKTLVIVHKTFLMNQWIERIEQFTDAKIGRIQQSIIDIEGKDIVIGMLQSISMKDYDDDIFADFGMVIVDEVHHISSKVFSRALPKINTKHMIGLSATPEREDGLSKVFHWFIGPMLHVEKRKISTNVLVRIYKYSCNDPKFKEKYQYVVNRRKNMVALPATLTNITTIDTRNRFIVHLVKECLKDPARQILILSGRLDQLDAFKALLPPDTSMGHYIGGMKQAVLKESEAKRVIFASYEMASEALDIPSLNTLILATSRKNIEQSVGRILRKESTTHPLVIDIVDKLNVFVNQGYSRRKFYKSCNYNMELYNVSTVLETPTLALSNSPDVSSCIPNIQSNIQTPDGLHQITLEKAITPQDLINNNDDLRHDGNNKPKTRSMFV